MQTKWIYQSNAIICHHTVRHDYPWWSVWWSWMVHVNDFDGIFLANFLCNFTSLRPCSWTTHGKRRWRRDMCCDMAIFCRFTSWAVWKIHSTGPNQPNPPIPGADEPRVQFSAGDFSISQALGHYQNGTSFQDLWLYRRPNLWRSNLSGLSCLHTGPLRNDAEITWRCEKVIKVSGNFQEHNQNVPLPENNPKNNGKKSTRNDSMWFVSAIKTIYIKNGGKSQVWTGNVPCSSR